MKNIIQTPLFFISPDPEKALGLELFIPNLYIICHNDSPYINYFKKCGVTVFRSYKNILPLTHKILANDTVSNFIKQNSQGQTPEILCFKNSLQIERLCVKKNYFLLNNSVNITKKFEDKIFQHIWLKSLHVKIPDTKCGELSKLPLEQLFIKWKRKTVVQYSQSHSGLGTYLCLPFNKIKEIKSKFPYRKIRFSKFIKGENWTVNACATKRGVYVSGLSYQLTGLTIATNYLGATVGNDWSFVKRLHSYQINDIIVITTKIGKSLYKNGFKGLFGIDFRINSKNIYVIEVNARQVASIPTHNHLALQRGIVPLSLLHLAEYKSSSLEDFAKMIKQYFGNKIFTMKKYNKLAHVFTGSRLIINNNSVYSLQHCSKTLNKNVYSIKTKTFIRKGLTMDDLKSAKEILCLPRTLSDKINTNTKMFQLLSSASFLNKQQVLSSNVVDLINILKKNYDHS